MVDEFSKTDSRSSPDDSPSGLPASNKPAAGLTQPGQSKPVEITEDSATRDLPENANVDFSEHRQTVISPTNTGNAQPKKQTSADVGRALQGTQLEHFHLEEFVGGGGMGAVFRATDEKLGRTVAVKVLSRNRKDVDSLRRFRIEAQSAARLDHPNIARVFYVGEDAGWNFIVFEYISGINIRELVSHRGPLPLQDCWSYVLQVADALTHASERDIVHRDIKPSNILVTSDGTAKLVDMGLARFHQLDSDNSDATASGVTLGTFDYISPEQARDPRNTDVRGDIYSLGCTLYYMLTGFAPYPAGTVLQKLLSHSGDPVPDPRVYREELDAGTVRILHKMLAKQPSSRYQTPRELIADVVTVGQHQGLTLSHAGHFWPSQRSRPNFSIAKHVPWIAPVVLLLLTVLVVSQLAPNDPPLIVAEPTFSTAPYIVPTAAAESKPATTNTPDQPAATLHGQDGQTDSDTLEASDATQLVTLFVGPYMSPLATNQLTVETFTEALSLVQENAKIAIVELIGHHEISSMALQLLDRQSQPITIRGGGESRSLIDVQLTARQLETNAPQFLHFSHGNISFKNLGFRFHLSPEFRQQWSIFQLDDVVSLRFENVVISVIPAATDNRYIQIAVFDYVTSPLASNNSAEQRPVIADEPAVLDLVNCVIRGPVNFLRTTPTQQIKATWRNGLFASSDWFLQMPSVTKLTTGNDTATKPNNIPISLTVDLQQLVVSATPGILRVYNDTIAGTRGLPPIVDFTMNHSILVTAPGNSVVLVDQITSSNETRYRPTISGSNNYYQNTMLMLIEHDRNEIAQTTHLTINELAVAPTQTQENDWFQQQNILPANSITWQATPVPPITTPDYLQTPNQYQLLDYQVELPGFDYRLLPVIE
ncbi:MAG: serine/threonine protein kinase [Planctomycetaceae bacterium]|nr:serine/threonine protein kinase [Planctomycetaceae bacterium]